MKKRMFIGLLVVVLMATLAIGGVAATAKNTSEFKGETTVLKASEVTDGAQFDLKVHLYADTSYDCVDAFNLALMFDSSVIKPSDDGILSATNGYTLAAMEMGANQLNVLGTNMNLKAPAADGLCTTITVRMEVVSASKLKSAQSAAVTINLYKNDYTVIIDGERCSYADVVEGIKQVDMTVKSSPMTVAVQGSSAATDTSEPDTIGNTTPSGTDTNNSSNTNNNSNNNSNNNTNNNNNTDTNSNGTNNTDTTDNTDTNDNANTNTNANDDNSGDLSGDETKEQITVTYEVSGGDAVSSTTVDAGAAVTLPAPSRAGYTFAGWYTDSELTSKISTVTFTPEKDVTLYAKWTQASGADQLPATGLEEDSGALLLGLCVTLALAGIVVSRKLTAKGNA